MLTHVTVNNLAIVDSLELEFSSGFSVLTGETGAGKSILIDALSLVLGDRADSSLVRTGATRADISACFELSKDQNIVAWLETNELLDQAQHNECILRRSINANGRSKGFINGQAVPMQSLRELGEQLINIHGQNSHQLLLSAQTQARLLDEHGQLIPLKQKLNHLFSQWKKKSLEFASLNEQQQQDQQQIELLTYQLQELEQFSPLAGELKKLEQDYKKLNHANDIIEKLNTIAGHLNDNNDYASNSRSVQQLLIDSTKLIDDVTHLDQSFTDIQEMLNQATIIADEVSSEIRQRLEATQADPQQLLELNERISLYYELSRKHQCDAYVLHEIWQQLQQKLSQLNHIDTHLVELQQQIKALHTAYFELAKKLSAKRGKTATQLAKLVEQHICDLGMEQAKFSIQLAAVDSQQQPLKDGLEQIQFKVSTNPGQAAGLLSKIASGGELSRISLAIQVVTAQYTEIPTLIFDEVDVGVGGKIAEKIGAKLHLLGKQAQILCVTHQAQVAAHGDLHYRVEKNTHQQQTLSTIEALNLEQRIDEFSRMLAGADITETTRSHAKEMFEQAQGLN